MKIKKCTSNQRGQGLIEYLVIVALVAVAGIAVMSIVGQSVRAQFANVANSIQGNGKAEVKISEVRDSHFQKRDMSDFFRGSTLRANSNNSDKE